MGTELKPEQIYGKKIIAVAGYDIFGKQLINTINKEVADMGLLLIGINIKEDDFGFFIHNLADSKVEVTIFLPEFQKKSAEFFGHDGYLLMAKKGKNGLEYVLSESETFIDDTKLLELVRMI